MIQVTRLNSIPFLMNSDLIELIEETPDTIVTLTTGKKFLVEESGAQILEKIIAFRRTCFREVLVKYEGEEKKGAQ